MAPALSHAAALAPPLAPPLVPGRIAGHDPSFAPAPVHPFPVGAFIDLAGPRRWADRVRELQRLAAGGPRAGRAERQRHGIEWTIERLRRGPGTPSPLETRIARLAAAAAELAEGLSPAGQDRLRAALDAALTGTGTLVGLFHLLRTASSYRDRGFAVIFSGLEEAAPFDLLLRREAAEAEVVCDVVSAEQGRGLPRAAWLHLADRIDADLQTWLAAHPGRYLLKMTLPDGLPLAADGETLAALHASIRRLLAAQSRSEQDAAVVLRLDPLLLAGAQADETDTLARLRREFGPEAQLAVTGGDGGLFVLAARAGREDAVAVAIRRRMAAIAPTRLTGTRPGILAMFIEDTERAEWRGLRDRLELEGEARQFLTCPEARPVVAVTCVSRFELLGMAPPDAVADGELRFRNPAHPAARSAALAPAVLSTV